ncbi:unnamed protein product [Cunninghamella echinulata]
MPLKVDSEDATRLIIQFLRENNLQYTLSKLQYESPITFNTVENKDAFIQDIIQGRWVSVLKQVSSLKLPIEKEFELHELALVELMEQGEAQAAIVVLNSPILQSLKRSDPDRYNKLDQLIDQKLAMPMLFLQFMAWTAQRKNAEKKLQMISPKKLPTFLLPDCSLY